MCSSETRQLPSAQARQPRSLNPRCPYALRSQGGQSSGAQAVNSPAAQQTCPASCPYASKHLGLPAAGTNSATQPILAQGASDPRGSAPKPSLSLSQAAAGAGCPKGLTSQHVGAAASRPCARIAKVSVLNPYSRCPVIASCSRLLLLLLSTLSPTSWALSHSSAVLPGPEVQHCPVVGALGLSAATLLQPSNQKMRSLNLAYCLPPLPSNLKSKFTNPSGVRPQNREPKPLFANVATASGVATQMGRARVLHKQGACKGLANLRMDSGYEGQIFDDQELLVTSQDDILVLGLSHKTAPVELREKLAVSEKHWSEFAGRIKALDSVQEAAVLSTCNRFEVYLVAHDLHNALREVLQFLNQHSKAPIPELQQHMLTLRGEHGVRHVFQVAAGLDSLVVGEGQILAQIKKCHEHATGANGAAGKVLNRLLNTAISAGKRVRTETDISKGSVSVSSAAIELAERKCGGDLGVPMPNCKVAIIGAGKMGKLLIQHLFPRNVQSITVVNRSREKAERMLQSYGANHDIQIATMDEMLDVIEKSDIIFTSTGATEPILNQQNLGGRVNQRKMFVDISVPRNIDESVKHVDLARAYNVDDLKVLVASNHAKRTKLIEDAEEILAEELESFDTWKLSLGTVPMITALQERAEAIRMAELSKVDTKLSGLTAAEKEMVDRLTKGIVNKLLHGPMAHLRTVDDVEERTHTVRSVAKMFLQEEDSKAKLKKGRSKKSKKKRNLKK